MDLFPVTATKPDGSTVPMARLAVRDGVVSLWRWGAGPERVMESTAPLVETARHRYTLGGVDGDWTIRYTPADCGCGSPLKSWSPRPHRVETGR
jgi:hypothetical protein